MTWQKVHKCQANTHLHQEEFLLADILIDLESCTKTARTWTSVIQWHLRWRISTADTPAEGRTHRTVRNIVRLIIIGTLIMLHFCVTKYGCLLVRTERCKRRGVVMA
jgi:hypothetical protein